MTAPRFACQTGSSLLHVLSDDGATSLCGLPGPEERALQSPPKAVLALDVVCVQCRVVQTRPSSSPPRSWASG